MPLDPEAVAERGRTIHDKVRRAMEADSSLAYDRSTKLRFYADARIPEYWVVDCTAEAIEVHRGPGPEGYRDVTRVAGTATLTLQAFPDVEVRTTDIFA